MSKRFTDANKWRSKWFRTLPVEAKLVWTYLCDECDTSGLMKPDFELASFQIGIEFGPEDLSTWFGKKIFFMGDDSILVVPFFEFQYGQSKDTWSAKVKARNVLESLGFQILNNQVIIPTDSHSDPTVGVQSRTVLIRGVSKGVVEVEGNTNTPPEKLKTPDPFFNRRFDRKALPRAAELWNQYCGPLTKLSGTCNLWNKISNEMLAEYGEDDFVAGVTKAATNPFLTGNSKSKWKATFSWIISKDHLAKVLAGDYDSENSVSSMLEQLKKELEAG